MVKYILERKKNTMNKIYVISDTHFGHYNLIKNNIRPVDFEQRIIKTAVKPPASAMGI